MHSAGSVPGETLNPAVVAAMAEVGIDISAERAQEADRRHGTRRRRRGDDGVRRRLPVYPGKRYVDWDLLDPAGKALEEVRPIRDDIATRVDALLDELLKA